MEHLDTPQNVFNRLSKTIHDLDMAIEQKSGEGVAMKAFAERLTFAKELQVKYPKTFEMYVAYHALIGSTPNYEPMLGRAAVTKQDFPGADSVELFLRKLKQDFEI